MAAVAFTACGPQQAPDISIKNGTLRLPAPGQTTGAAYFDIINNGGADVLLSASTPASPHSELHTHIHENNIMKMRKVDHVDIAAKETTAFKRGGLHVMVFDINVPAGKASIPLTLTFERSGEITFSAFVDGKQPPKIDHSKMNHDE